MPKRERNSKAGFRWKRISKLAIYIEISRTGRCWRAVTTAEKSAPQPMESTAPVSIKVCDGKTYQVRAMIRREKEKPYDRHEFETAKPPADRYE